MPVRWAIANGNFSTGSTWNDGATLGVPTGSDDLFTNAFTVNINQSFSALSLNNSAFTPRLSNTAIPQMTSNASPSGIANASSNATNAFITFNRDYNYLANWASSTVNTGWVSYQFPTSKIIKRYAVWGGSSMANISSNQWNPRDWTFEGSNDGASWTTLETVSAYAMTLAGNYISGILPNTASFAYYRVNVTAVQSAGNTPIITEIEMTESTEIVGGTAGGSFNFNSGSISGSATSATPLSAGATNLITVTATTGSVGLTLGGALSFGNGYSIISHTGNCNFNLTGVSYTISNPGVAAHALINKSSAGTMTVQGTLLGGTGAGAGVNVLSSTNGNTIILGNVLGATRGTGTIVQTAGNLIISGSVTGGTAGSVLGISFTGTSISVVGDIAGRTAEAINTTGPVFVTGNITGSATAGITTTAPVIVTGSVVAQGAAAAISSTSAIFINVSGSVQASSTANGISSTNASAVVNLAGNIVNVNGRQAIYCQNLFLDNTATTQAQFFTVGSQDRTLYSADTFPNLPSTSNVRFGTTYGPGSGNTGTLRMASPQDVRSGVLTDNTTGSAILSIESLSNEVQTSTDPFAQRLRNIATVDAVGYLLTAFKK